MEVKPKTGKLSLEDFFFIYPQAETKTLKEEFSKKGIKVLVRHGAINGFGYITIETPIGTEPSTIRAIFEQTTGKGCDEISETNGFFIFPYSIKRRRA